MTRSFWVWLHRWTGLILAGFLIVVGTTGSLLVFLPELDRLVTPQIHARAQEGPPLDPATLAERAETLVPAARVVSLYLGDPGVAELTLSPRTDPATGQTHVLGFDQLLLDRSSGAELARRTLGAISEGWVNLMPFIYAIHYELAVGPAGDWVLGIAALAWTIDSFVGFYLTLPVARKRSPVSAMTDAARRAVLVVALGNRVEDQGQPPQFRPAPRRRTLALGDAADFRLVQRVHESLGHGLRHGNPPCP